MSLELAIALNRIGRPRILVVGDYIVDRTVHCESVRFAQEAAHCPVYRMDKAIDTPGGAGAVDVMVLALGAGSVLVANSQTPAIKRRYMVNGVQQFRVDTEAVSFAGDCAVMAREISQHIGHVDAVLIADYGKGVCTDAVLRAAIDGAKDRGIPCIVDPHKRPWERYKGASALKCNWHQWQKGNLDGYFDPMLIVTEGERGIRIHNRLEMDQFSSRHRQVIDVTGAGDMVLAALGVCIAGGMSWPDACRVANAAAGLKVERRGADPVPRFNVVVDLLDGEKIVPAELLSAVSHSARNHGKNVVWLNGCFDGIHKGHLHLFAEAKKQGDLLIVGVNSDASVQHRKGSGRPTNAGREELVAALGMVDYVVPFETQQELAACIEAVMPDVLAIGSDWRGKTIVGSELAKRVHFVERLPGFSTTDMLAK